VVLERIGRVDEAIIEWQEAFAAGSTDAKTADRLSLNLDKAKRFEEAATVCRVALSRGLPANTEDTLRKRLERLERKVTPGGSKKDVPAFSVRRGEGYARLLLQQRLSPPLRDLAIHEQTAYCLAYKAEAGIVTRVNLETGENTRTEGLPTLNEIRISPNGWGIGLCREGRVGDGSTLLAFLTPLCEVHATAALPDSLSQVSYAASRWFVGCRDGRLYAYDLGGSPLWDWVTPGSESYDDDNPYFRPCSYYVSATEQFVAVASFDKVYAVDFTGQTMWQIDAPNQGPLTFTSSVKGGQPNDDAWSALNLAPGASDAEVKKAYRAMVFATHPDHNPGNPLAAENFRGVQRAYEGILAGEHQPVSAGITVTISGASWVSGLTAAANTILVSSSDGVLSSVNAAGQVVSRRVLGKTRVVSALLPNGTLAATFCDGTLSFYAAGDIVNAVPVGDEYPSTLIPWRDDVVFYQGNSLKVFDRAGRNVWAIEFPKQLASVTVNDRFLICGAGALDVFQRN